jgi:hypothetical protein
MKKYIVICLFALNIFNVFAEVAVDSNQNAASVEIADLRQAFKTPIGAKGLEFDEKFKLLNDHVVQMTGFIVKSEEPVVGYFLLSVRPIQLNEHADGEANDLPPSTVQVLLDQSQADKFVPYVNGPQTFRGVLRLGRSESQDKVISWIRLQLPVISN